MSAFNFNLEKVLNVRNIQEDIAQNNYMKAKKKKEEIKDELDKLNETKNETFNFLRNKANSSVEMTLQARRFLQLHKKKIDNQKSVLEKQKHVLQKKQREMIEKQKKRKVLDKLREKEYYSFYKEQMKAEQKELDEIAQRNNEVK